MAPSVMAAPLAANAARADVMTCSFIILVGEHLAGMLEADAALRIAAQHARELPYSLFLVQLAHPRERRTLALDFFDKQVMRGARGQLRQMRNYEYLVMLCDVAQLGRHLRGYPPTNAGIHFVEDQRRHTIDARKDRLERQHDTG